MFYRARTIAVAAALVATAGLGLIVASPAAAEGLPVTSAATAIAAQQPDTKQGPISGDRTARDTSVPSQSGPLNLPVLMMTGLGVLFGGVFLVVGTGGRKNRVHRH